MVWNAQNSPFAGNFASYGAPNYGAYSAPNYAAHGGHNYGAYGAPNYAAHAAPNYSPNYAAHAAPNYAAHSAPNYGASASPAGPGLFLAPVPMGSGGATGAGGASGSGFVAGYGHVARFEYATPAALAPLPWVLDFALGEGWPSFPLDLRLDPYAFSPHMSWQLADWDPGLRFWTLKFDPQLTEWLQDLNLAAPAVMAAREFANSSDRWLASSNNPPTALHSAFEANTALLGWRVPPAIVQAAELANAKRKQAAKPNPAETAKADAEKEAWIRVKLELDELVDLMRDDRMRYLAELGVQSSQAVPYFVHLMRFDPTAKPWTMELMNCASSIGNLVKMQYKSHYLRVRPSTLCPGLTPPWGPAGHPSFPSGHSTVAHLTALLLLSIPGIAQRFGIYENETNHGRQPALVEFGPSGTNPNTKTKAYGEDQRSPLLWLAWRIAKGRERMGVHYQTDSAAGRWLAALVWNACVSPNGTLTIDVPSLRNVLHKAEAEWPLQRLTAN